MNCKEIDIRCLNLIPPQEDIKFQKIFGGVLYPYTYTYKFPLNIELCCKIKEDKKINNNQPLNVIWITEHIFESK